MGGVIELSNSNVGIRDSELREGEYCCKEWGSLTVGRFGVGEGKYHILPSNCCHYQTKFLMVESSGVAQTFWKSVKMAWLAWCECGGKTVCLVTLRDNLRIKSF